MDNSRNVARSRARVAAMAVLLLLAVSCSSSGTTKSSTSSDSSTRSAETSTDSGGSATSSDTGAASTDTGDTSDTSDTGSGSTITKDDLEKLLPEASAVGPTYSEKESDSDSSSSSDSSEDKTFEDAAAKQCPELIKVFKKQKDDHETAKRTYESSAGGQIEVELTTPAKPISNAVLDAQVKAINDCGSIKTKISGQDVTINISAERNDSLGDQGYNLGFKIDLSVLGMTFTLQFTGHAYRVGNVGVMVSAMGDLDKQKLTSIPPDTATAEKVATELEPQVKQLTGG